MNKFKFFLIFQFLLFMFLIFISSGNANFFYEIVKDFNILYNFENIDNFIVYYRYYDQVKQRYFIYGYDTKNDKNYGFSPSNEFITTKPFFNENNDAFAYGALYQGNDFVWYKDFKNNSAYKILYSISGKLSLLSLDRSHKNIIVGFDYLAPQQFLYISGVKEFYTYPMASYPNIVETNFTFDEKFIYVIYKYENLFNCDILPLSENPYKSSSYKPPVKKIFSNAEEVLLSDSSVILTREKEQYFFYNMKDYSKNKVESLLVLKDINNDKNCIVLIDGSLYDKNLEKIEFVNENENKIIDQKKVINYLKLGKKIVYSNNYLLLNDDENSFYIFIYNEERKIFKFLSSITLDIKNFNLISDGKILLINQIEGNLIFLVYNSYLSSNSISILLYNKDDAKIETLYSDYIYSFIKGLNCYKGFAFLVKKIYTRGIYQELYFYSFNGNILKKISGWENVMDTELELIKRKD